MDKFSFGFLSHICPDGNWAEVITYLAQSEIKKRKGKTTALSRGKANVCVKPSNISGLANISRSAALTEIKSREIFVCDKKQRRYGSEK